MKAPHFQFPVFDNITSKASEEEDRLRSVKSVMREVRQLHEELNELLEIKQNERPYIHNPEDAFKLIHPFLGHLDHEELWVIVMDTRNKVMAFVMLYRGTVNTTQIRVSEVFRQAIIENAPSIILAHNHPTGDPTTSPEDVAITKEINEAGILLDIRVLDHMVLGRKTFVSMREQGLGFD